MKDWFFGGMCRESEAKWPEVISWIDEHCSDLENIMLSLEYEDKSRRLVDFRSTVDYWVAGNFLHPDHSIDCEFRFPNEEDAALFRLVWC